MELDVGQDLYDTAMNMTTRVTKEWAYGLMIDS